MTTSGDGSRGDKTVADATVPDTDLATLVRTAFERHLAGARPEEQAALAPLTELFTAMAAADLAAAVEAGESGGPLAAAAARSVAELARQLGLARADAAVVVRAGQRLVTATAGAGSAANEASESWEAAFSALKRGAPRAQELSDVIDQLDDVASQTTVAALNASVELSRGEGVEEATLAELGEQIRRLSERAVAVARRLTAAADDIRGAWTDASQQLEGLRDAVAEWRARADRCEEHAQETASAAEAAFGTLRRINLPDDARGAEAAARLMKLEARFSEELESLTMNGGELPEELTAALARLRGRLRLLGEPGR